MYVLKMIQPHAILCWPVILGNCKLYAKENDIHVPIESKHGDIKTISGVQVTATSNCVDINLFWTLICLTHMCILE